MDRGGGPAPRAGHSGHDRVRTGPRQDPLPGHRVSRRRPRVSYLCADEAEPDGNSRDGVAVCRAARVDHHGRTHRPDRDALRGPCRGRDPPAAPSPRSCRRARSLRSDPPIKDVDEVTMHSLPATPCAPDELPLPLSCSRWWIRNLRRRSSCRWDASWCRRSGRAARRHWCR